MIEIIKKASTLSAEETESVAAEFADRIYQELRGLKKGNLFVALYGDVGAGKTVFVRGMASVLCPDDHVQSPTYAIVHEYKGEFRVCHYDMYRITSEDDLESTGFYDYNNCLIIAEWCENIPYAIPDCHYRITVAKTDMENGRSILIEKVTNQ